MKRVLAGAMSSAALMCWSAFAAAQHTTADRAKEVDAVRARAEELAKAASERFGEVLEGKRQAEAQPGKGPPSGRLVDAGGDPWTAARRWLDYSEREYRSLMRRLGHGGDGTAGGGQPRVPAANASQQPAPVARKPAPPSDTEAADWVTQSSKRFQEIMRKLVERAAPPGSDVPSEGREARAPAAKEPTAPNQPPASAPSAMTPPQQRNTEERRLAENRRAVREAEVRKTEEVLRAEQAKKLTEAKAAEDARKAEEARKASEAEKAAEAQKAEQARRLAEAKAAEDARKAEAARKASEAKKATQAEKVGQAKQPQEARQPAQAEKAASARKVAEERKAAAEARRAEAQRKAEEARQRRAEARRVRKEKREAEAKRMAEIRAKDAEERRLAAAETAKRRAAARAALLEKRAQAREVAARKAAAGKAEPKAYRERVASKSCEGAGSDIATPGWYVIKQGDTLWHIAEKHYGAGWRYRRIYAANRRRLRDPHHIRPCQRVYLPRAPRRA